MLGVQGTEEVRIPSRITLDKLKEILLFQIHWL